MKKAYQQPCITIYAAQTGIPVMASKESIQASQDRFIGGPPISAEKQNGVNLPSSVWNVSDVDDPFGGMGQGNGGDGTRSNSGLWD